MSGHDTVAECVDRDVFRDVIGRFATGVAIITTHDAGADYGMTASAVTSLTLDPPMVVVCVNRATPTQKAISRTGTFAVNVLREDQGELARRFGAPVKDKFSAVTVTRGRQQVPLIDNALAHLECDVVNDVAGGTHSVFLAEVRSASGETGAPLAYFRGQFGRLELAHDEAVYGDLREMILSRALRAGAVLDVLRLQQELNAEPSAVFHALTRLSLEGLLSRDPESGYVVTALDDATLRAALDARNTIELGSADLTVGRLTEAQLAELRRRMEATEPQFHGGEHLSGSDYFRANKAFHEYIVELAAGPQLLSVYRRLTIDGILLRSFAQAELVGDDTIEDHREIVRTFDAGDVDAARHAIRHHNDRVLELTRAALAAAGGTL